MIKDPTPFEVLEAIMIGYGSLIRIIDPELYKQAMKALRRAKRARIQPIRIHPQN